jgi:hypothetical protein
MSENMQPQNNSEEVDLGQLFKLIGNAFDRFVNFIASIFKWLFSVIIYVLKAIVINIKIILIVVIIASILGYVLDKYKPKVYSSQMLVKPYFDSKYQLFNTIDYYNALIGNEDFSTLSKIFEIDEQEVKEIINFEVKMGPETENERILEYNEFLKFIDTTSSAEISYDSFINNRSIYSSDLFEIEVSSFKKDIFSKLEKGIGESFTNKHSEKMMKKRDSLISIQKENIRQQLDEVAGLQDVYIKVLEEESKSSSTEISFGGEGLSLNKDKTQTREFDLLNRELQLRNELKTLDELKLEEDVIVDVVVSFQEVGNRKLEWYEKYSIIFPVTAFILLCVLYLLSKAVTFVKHYEA